MRSLRIQIGTGLYSVQVGALFALVSRGGLGVASACEAQISSDLYVQTLRSVLECRVATEEEQMAATTPAPLYEADLAYCTLDQLRQLTWTYYGQPDLRLVMAEYARRGIDPYA